MSATMARAPRVSLTWSSPFCVGAAAVDASDDEDASQRVPADDGADELATNVKQVVAAKR